MILALLQIVASGTTFDCTPIRVWDGDGPIWCAEGPRIRLTGVAAREIDGSCRRGHPCPSASGPAARDALVRLIGKPVGRAREGHVLVEGPTMTCQSEGSGKGSRTSAWCWSGRMSVNCAMVHGGWAVRWVRYDPQNRCRASSAD